MEGLGLEPEDTIELGGYYKAHYVIGDETDTIVITGKGGAEILEITVNTAERLGQFASKRQSRYS